MPAPKRSQREANSRKVMDVHSPFLSLLKRATESGYFRATDKCTLTTVFSIHLPLVKKSGVFIRKISFEG